MHVKPHIAKPITLYSMGWRIIASVFILSLGATASSSAQIIIDDEALKQAQPAPPKEQPTPAQSPAAGQEYIPPSDAFVDYYYANMMNIKPYLPQNLQRTELGCSTLTARNTEQYAASISTDFSQPYWENRVKSD